MSPKLKAQMAYQRGFKKRMQIFSQNPSQVFLTAPTGRVNFHHHGNLLTLSLFRNKNQLKMSIKIFDQSPSLQYYQKSQKSSLYRRMLNQPYWRKLMETNMGLFQNHRRRNLS
jgi:hypothetical protein